MNNFNNGYGYSNGRFFNSPAYMPNYQQGYISQPRADQVQPNGLFFNNIRYVNPSEMASYVVLAGNTDVIINKQDGVFQIKSADMAGNSFTRTFKFDELNNFSNDKQSDDTKPEMDLTGYVKTDDLKDFIKVDALESFSKQINDKIDALQKKIKINEILEEK